RNFCIIAHIDHGKSTLADRFLELTHTVESRKMRDQILDQMDLERERGITIKLQPVRMSYDYKGAQYILNLIDTPGHVDFNYEVSRSLAACEGAILLVDATQGVQAQTIGNLYLALEHDLEIIPVLNKIDLPAANVEKRSQEIVSLLGCKKEDILHASGKTGQGVLEILNTVIDRVPPPQGDSTANPRALVFDSVFDEYRGVVAYVRVADGIFSAGKKLRMNATGVESEILEVGSLKPAYSPTKELETGQIGYVVTGLKDISACRVGDTLGLSGKPITPLPGYKEAVPMVFAGIFPEEGDDYSRLRDAIEKLRLNDASLWCESERSSALGYGFRCGMLGMLHLEIVQERLRREFGLELVVTTPSVAYIVVKRKGDQITIRSPQDLPDPSHIDHIKEPWVSLDIVSPAEYIGAIMQLSTERHANYITTEYLDSDRVILKYELPLASIVVDYYDKLKTISSGYASLNYKMLDYRQADVVKMDLLVNDDPVEALSVLVYRDEAFRIGKKIVQTLKESIPKQMIVVKIQAAIGGKVVAAERISALRKDVTAKLYGGDVTRKNKLLEKQKKGKKKMLEQGKVRIPSSAYLSVLKR
ncbi:TPA: elongation factor 4, partial [Candidatus Uhrbacteria bacterium]|nr:elongation factor 4 [Candidatus Uhrbacteria bacterium]